jgi:hypothetical protein
LAFVNTSAAPIEVRLLAIRAPGFESPRLVDVRPGDFPVYLHADQQPRSWAGTKLTVPPGGIETARTELVPLRESGSSLISAIVSWNEAQAAPIDEGVELGPVRRASPGLQFVGNALDTATSLVQTLALPLVLALLGWWLQQNQQSYVQERQAWASMLPISHKNNVMLYVPLTTGIATLEAYLPRKSEISEEDLKQGCFFLLYCVRRVREVDANGWFYLLDREAEDLCAYCWDVFRDTLLERIKPYETVSRVLDVMSPNETYSKFLRKRERLTEIAKAAGSVEKQYRNWVQEEKERDFVPLFLLRELLLYEINRIYEFWYGKPPEFKADRCRELLKKLEDTGGEAGKLAEGVRKHYQEFLSTERRPVISG